MTRKQAIEESIKHWERMIEWAEKQPKQDKVSFLRMEDELDESWSGDFCALCKGYCATCPLRKKYGYCNIKNPKNAWGKVYSSKTWSEWLKHAKVMLRQLKSLRKEK